MLVLRQVACSAVARFQICDALFETVIALDAPFGVVLRRVKLQYDATIAAGRAVAQPRTASPGQGAAVDSRRFLELKAEYDNMSSEYQARQGAGSWVYRFACGPVSKG
jgi:hypothetical protein